MTFEQKVKSMTAKEIIMAMVEGLRNPTTEISMSCYGQVIEGVCYGCAATNTICNIGGYAVEDLISYSTKSNSFLSTISREDLTQGEFVGVFEEAINDLRLGEISSYNLRAERHGFATINDNGKTPPYLSSHYTPADLLPYEQLANDQ